MDAVTRYDIDGVHFDDYFYPYPAARPGASRRRRPSRQYGAGFTDRADWRRDNINLLIQEMSGAIKAAKPWVKFGVSPFGIWRNKAADPLGSDTTGSQSYDDHLRRHPQVGQGGAGSTTSCRSSTGTSASTPAADYARARAVVGRGGRAAPACSSTSARPTTRAATPAHRPTGRTRTSCPTT